MRVSKIVRNLYLLRKGSFNMKTKCYGILLKVCDKCKCKEFYQLLKKSDRHVFTLLKPYLIG